MFNSMTLTLKVNDIDDVGLYTSMPANKSAHNICFPNSLGHLIMCCSASSAVRLITLPAFEYSAVLNHLSKLSEVQFPQRARNVRFDLTRCSTNSAPRFYKILLCQIDWLTERSAGSRSGRIRALPSERSEQGAVSPAGSRARSEVYTL